MITVNMYYTGTNGSARLFAREMEASGTAATIRAEQGNFRYEYFFPMNDPETVLLIDAWDSQEAIDRHHASPHDGDDPDASGEVRPAHEGGAVREPAGKCSGREVYQKIKDSRENLCAICST